MKYIYQVQNTIYPLDTLKLAAQDFQDVSTIEVSENTIQIESEQETQSIEIFHEFMNYTISLMN